MSLTNVKIGDQSWAFDEESLTLADAFAIKQASGLALKPFFEGIAEMDPLALQTLVWFVRHKAGEQIRPGDVAFRVMDLDISQPEDPTTAEATDSASAATA